MVYLCAVVHKNKDTGQIVLSNILLLLTDDFGGFFSGEFFNFGGPIAYRYVYPKQR